MLVLSVADTQKVNIWSGNKMKQNAIKFFSGLLITFYSICSYAAPSRMDSTNLFDSILKMFHDTAHTWSNTIFNYASWLFWSLALISMVWTFGLMALQKADIQEFFREMLKFIVTLGFFFWILLNGPSIASSIIDSLRQLAADASGLSYTISPSDIVDVGFDIVSKAIDNSTMWSPVATGIGIIVAGVILIILTLVAMNMLIILISGWIVTYGGVFLLGFGGGRWTQDIAINYYRSILGIALQAFAMILIIGIGKSFIDQYYALMSKDILLKEMFIMLTVSIVLLVLINKIPPMLAGLVHGGGNFGGGGGVTMGGGLGLSGAMGAVGVAGAAAAAGMGAASAQAAGGATALHCAFKAAAQSVGGDSTSTSIGGNSSTTKLGGLASAMGQASQFAGSFASHLGSGIAAVASDKKDSIKSSISEAVSGTAGGKVATSISEKMGGGASNDNAPTQSSNQIQSTDNVDAMSALSGNLSGDVGEGSEIDSPIETSNTSMEG